MNISSENIDKVSALLTVKIEKADYQEKVDKSLKSLRQKAQIPGFRKGMVPMSLIQKMYRKAVIAEEVNEMLLPSIYTYIKENNISVLGEPLHNEEKQLIIDFDTMDDFEFFFDIAIAPEFEVNVTSEDEVDYYTIEVTDEMVENQIKTYTQRTGKYEKVESYEEKDMLKGLIAELDENGSTKEGGIQEEGAVIMPAYMKDAAQKALFNGAKLNDVLVFNPNKAYEGHDVEIASLLHIEVKQAEGLMSDFSFQVEEITRFVYGELNRELFDQVFGEDVVKNEEEFRAKVKETITAQFAADSDHKFLLDVREMLTKKVGKLEFAEAILKRFMLLSSEDKDEKFVDEHYEKSVEELIWHLIREKLEEEYALRVEQSDVISMAEDMVRMEFAQYGMLLIPDELLDKYVKEMLGKKENIDRIFGRVRDMKLAEQLKGNAKLTPKTVSLDEFTEFFN